jgi:hypothetical protein
VWTLFTALAAVPIYYRARARGYPAAVFTVVTILLSLAVMVLGTQGRSLLLTGLATMAAFAAAVFLLPPRRGAPGATVLCTCSSCNEEVPLPVQRQGLTSACPNCGELLTVPLLKEAEHPQGSARRKPNVSSGMVEFRAFANPLDAESLRQALTESGLSAEILVTEDHVVLPTTWQPSTRVFIDVVDWERAEGIEREWRESAPGA